MDTIHPLRAFREKQSPPLTQDQLADLIGCSKAAVSRWEAGERSPDEESLPKIIEKTGIPARALRPDLAGMFDPAPTEPQAASS